MRPATCASCMRSRNGLMSGWSAKGGPSLLVRASTSCRPAPCSTLPAGPNRTSLLTMADAAHRQPAAKQRWALPGSGHDRLVRWSKVLLPSAVGVLIAVLALAPLDKHGDVSFILDKNKVESVPERMRLESAHYTGTDTKGQPFQITANRAIQRSSNVPLVDIHGVLARLGL